MDKKKITFGFDPGFGYIKFAYMKEDGEIVSGKFISGIGWSNKNDTGSYDWNRKYWYVGKKALIKPNIIELASYKDLAKYSHMFLIEAIKQAGLEPVDIEKVVCGLSLAHKEEAEEFANNLSSFNIGDTKYSFKIMLVAQAEGANYLIQDISNTEKIKNYMIVDIGSNTVDILVSLDGNVSYDSLEGYENKGVKRISQKLQTYLVNNDIGQISLSEATEALESKKIKLYGKETLLDLVIKEMSVEFTKETMSFIENTYDNELKYLDKIFFVGGGAHYIDVEKMEHFVVPENPEFFNAVGNLKAARD